MICNISRTQNFQQCRRKQWYYDQGYGDSYIEPLAMGSAYHEGVAVLTARRDREAAMATAEASYRDSMTKMGTILPEEHILHERNIELVKRMLSAQADQYLQDAWTVLKPEVEGLVAIPGTEHHCWFVHRILHPDDVSMDFTACTDGRCRQLHRLKFKTDAVLNWHPLIWVMERKTSGMKQAIFWDQWYLSHQLTAYVYGVRKTTGLPVNGVILEKMPKPAKNQDPYSFNYTPEREPFVRDEDEITAWEQEFIGICNDYERAAVQLAQGLPLNQTFYRNPQSCIDYNRRCNFWDACKRHHVNEGEFRRRDPDYVEREYYNVLGMEVPISVKP